MKNDKRGMERLEETRIELVDAIAYLLNPIYNRQYNKKPHEERMIY